MKTWDQAPRERASLRYGTSLMRGEFEMRINCHRRAYCTEGSGSRYEMKHRL